MAQVHPLENPATAQWDLPINHTDYTKLLKGFQPQDMDDKWLCLTDEPDAQGNTTVHAYRSWTGQEMISLAVVAGKPNEIEAKSNEWGKITTISWRERPGEITEEEAKGWAVGICRRGLGCDLENA